MSHTKRTTGSLTVEIEREVGYSVSLNGGNLDDVECFRYLGADMIIDGTMGDEISLRMKEGNKVMGAMMNV